MDLQFFRRIALPAFARLVLLLPLFLAACVGTPTVAPGPTVEHQPTPTGAQQRGTPAASASQVPTQRPAVGLGIALSDLRGVAIQFWHGWSGETSQALQSLVEDFNRDNPWGIQAQASYQGGYDDLSANVAAALDGGRAPDAVAVYPYQAQTWRAGEHLAALDALIGDSQWGLSAAEQADFYPAFWSQDLLDGKRWGLPALGWGEFLVYNTSWGQELGFSSPPSTTEAFTEQVCAAALAALKDDEPQNDHKGGWIVSTDYPAMLGWVAAFGGQVVSPQGGYQFDTRPAAEAFSFLRRLYDRGCAWLPESQTPEGDFATRLGLVASASLSALPYQETILQRAGSSDEWTVIPFPSPQGKPAIEVYGPSFYILAAAPKEQLASWLLIKWLVEPRNQARLAQAAGAFPVRKSAHQDMADYARQHSQWAAASQLLPQAAAEPGYASWETVRWAVQDAATQLFRSYFSAQQVPGELMPLLQATARELDSGKRP